MNPTQRARLQLVAAAVLFSTGGAAIKASAITSWQVASLRSGIAAFTLALLLPEARRGLRRRTVAGVRGVCRHADPLRHRQQAHHLGQHDLPAGHGPLYLLLLAPWLLQERIRGADVAFMAVVGRRAWCSSSWAPTRRCVTAPGPVPGERARALSGFSFAVTIAGAPVDGRGRVGRLAGRRGGAREPARLPVEAAVCAAGPASARRTGG